MLRVLVVMMVKMLRCPPCSETRAILQRLFVELDHSRSRHVAFSPDLA